MRLWDHLQEEKGMVRYNLSHLAWVLEPRGNEERTGRQTHRQKARVGKGVWVSQAVDIQEEKEEAAVAGFVHTDQSVQHSHLNRARLGLSLASVRRDFANSCESEALSPWHSHDMSITYVHSRFYPLRASFTHSYSFLLPPSFKILPTYFIHPSFLHTTPHQNEHMDLSAVMSLKWPNLFTYKFIFKIIKSS